MWLLDARMMHGRVSNTLVPLIKPREKNLVSGLSAIFSDVVFFIIFRSLSAADPGVCAV
jgi:hypothetical protein